MAGWDYVIGHSDGELSTVDWGNTASVARGSARAAIAVPCTLLYLPLVSFVLLYNKEIHSNIRFFFMVDGRAKFHPPLSLCELCAVCGCVCPLGGPGGCVAPFPFAPFSLPYPPLLLLFPLFFSFINRPHTNSESACRCSFCSRRWSASISGVATDILVITRTRAPP